MSRLSILVGMLVVVTASLGAQTSGSGDEPAAGTPPKLKKIDPPDRRIEQLVAALGHEDFHQREKASAALAELGEKARDHLERARDHRDPEVRARVDALLDRLSADQTAPGELPRRGKGSRRDPGGRAVDRNAPFPRPRDFPDHDEFMRALRAWMESRPSLDRFFELAVPPGLGSRADSWSTSIHRGGERVTLRVTPESCRLTVARPDPQSPGRRQTLVYDSPSLEDFAAKYPDVYARYKDTGIFEKSGLRFHVFDSAGALDSPIGNLLRELLQVDPGAPLRRSAARRELLGIRIRADRRARPAPAGGVEVVEVEPGSLAERLGVRPGDILLSLNGSKLDDADDISPALRAIDAGGDVRLRISRGGRVQILDGQKPGPAPEAPRRKASPPLPPRPGSRIKKI